MDILGISYTSDQNIYVAVLGEDGGDRKVPVVITYGEAQSIAIEMEKISPIVPLIYDVVKNIVINNKLKYNEILISDFKNDILITHIVGKKDEIELRTADALSLSIRMECPIYIFEDVLERVNLVVKKYYDIHKSDQVFIEKDFKGLSMIDLKALLEKALYNEDYEKASMIRDEINKKKKDIKKD